VATLRTAIHLLLTHSLTTTGKNFSKSEFGTKLKKEVLLFLGASEFPYNNTQVEKSLCAKNQLD